ncbi:MAG: DNA polymerase III subunit epsilon [Dokdonella sp.]|uniref:DNA polymerase III subunit epsilon n=1 Tax=Dokdonella sp. TaxID=2291710 RepID=UPI0025BDD214|nr:DNA polymerase III subunit epsilon [Dokdonella sp.]MBZ0223188.1 DNA polymerase III subunit epsilon [Dokdonella sp.]MCC7255180.1 DNA polymerase III subunit epsilon [Dokdonella sp.]
MRQVFLDTETTGLEVEAGHRVIEIGCIELVQRRRTGREFHTYLNPDRAIDEGARAVTGISDESLLDKPRFGEIAQDFLAFIDDAELIAHNARFDLAFLDAELTRAGLGGQRLGGRLSVIDTLALAREKFPGQRNTLDALCKRLDVDNSHRSLHGALLDANLLVEVYLALTSGQGALGFDEDDSAAPIRASVQLQVRTRPLVRRASAVELALHEARLAAIDAASKGACVWKRD